MTLLPQVSPPFITEVQPKMCHVNVKYVNRAVLYQVSFHAVCVHVIECVIGMCVCVCVFVRLTVLWVGVRTGYRRGRPYHKWVQSFRERDKQ